MSELTRRALLKGLGAAAVAAKTGALGEAAKSVLGSAPVPNRVVDALATHIGDFWPWVEEHVNSGHWVPADEDFKRLSPEEQHLINLHEHAVGHYEYDHPPSDLLMEEFLKEHTDLPEADIHKFVAKHLPEADRHALSGLSVHMNDGQLLADDIADYVGSVSADKRSLEDYLKRYHLSTLTPEQNARLLERSDHGPFTADTYDLNAGAHSDMEVYEAPHPDASLPEEAPIELRWPGMAPSALDTGRPQNDLYIQPRTLLNEKFLDKIWEEPSIIKHQPESAALLSPREPEQKKHSGGAIDPSYAEGGIIRSARDLITKLDLNELDKVLGFSTVPISRSALNQARADVAAGVRPSVAAARAKGLPTDFASTEGRRIEYGFAHPAYHGTTQLDSRLGQVADEIANYGYPEFADPVGNPLRVEKFTNFVRGSRDFHNLEPGFSDKLSTYIGPHLAPDPAIANSFTGASQQEAGNTLATIEHGRVFPVWLRGDMHDVPQPQRIPHSLDDISRGWVPPLMSDDHAVQVDAMERYYREHPDALMTWIMLNRKLPSDTANQMAQDFARTGFSRDPQHLWDFRDPGGHKEPFPVLGRSLFSYLDDYGAGPTSSSEFAAMGDQYTRSLAREGTPIVRYQNTAPHETRFARDPTSYIQTDPAGIRSRFAVFDPDLINEPGLNYAEGGKIGHFMHHEVEPASKEQRLARRYYLSGHNADESIAMGAAPSFDVDRSMTLDPVHNWASRQLHGDKLRPFFGAGQRLAEGGSVRADPMDPDFAREYGFDSPHQLRGDRHWRPDPTYGLRVHFNPEYPEQHDPPLTRAAKNFASGVAGSVMGWDPETRDLKLGNVPGALWGFASLPTVVHDFGPDSFFTRAAERSENIGRKSRTAIGLSAEPRDTLDTAASAAGTMTTTLPIPMGPARAARGPLSSATHWLGTTGSWFVPAMEASPKAYVMGTAIGTGLEDALRGATDPGYHSGARPSTRWAEGGPVGLADGGLPPLEGGPLTWAPGAGSIDYMNSSYGPEPLFLIPNAPTSFGPGLGSPSIQPVSSPSPISTNMPRDLATVLTGTPAPPHEGAAGAESGPSPGPSGGPGAAAPAGTSSSYGLGPVGRGALGLAATALGAPPGTVTAIDAALSIAEANSQLGKLGAPSISLGQALQGIANNALFGLFGKSFAQSALENAASTDAALGIGTPGSSSPQGESPNAVANAIGDAIANAPNADAQAAIDAANMGGFSSDFGQGKDAADSSGGGWGGGPSGPGGGEGIGGADAGGFTAKGGHIKARHAEGGPVFHPYEIEALNNYFRRAA